MAATEIRRIAESCIRDIKARANLREIAGVELKGKNDDFIGLCPLHNEKTPSFHLHPGRGFFKCFGCGASGDVIDFVRASEGLDFMKAAESLCAKLGIPVEYDDGTTAAGNAGVRRQPTPRIETRAPSQTWNRLQKQLRSPTIAEIGHIADHRHLSLAALELAVRHDHLFVGEVFDFDFPGADSGYEYHAWIVTDSARINAQARRMDGNPWDGIGGKKAKTISGCEANWPIGISTAATPGIALVEGGPDFLSAWHFIWEREQTRHCSPVAMLGAAQKIHPAALPLFKDRKVWIFPHQDENGAGEDGAARWRDQLLPIARFVEFFKFPPGIKDLNELAQHERSMEVDDVT